METLRLDGPLDETLVEPLLLLAFDGWTDAGRGGTTAAAILADAWHARTIGSFDPDALFDYRDRRPLLHIDRGVLGEPDWPAVSLIQLSAPEGFDALLITGTEPDLGWQALSRDIVELARLVGAQRYIGLGAVPGPVPHTRPARVITTASREDLFGELGRPHEEVIVPASCQVIIEATLRDAGLTTLGLWARVPHYVAGEYPAGAKALLQRVAAHLDVAIDMTELGVEVGEHRERLDAAAAASTEITEHVRQLETAFDAELDAGGMGGPLPTGDEIAAELQRFLQDQRGDDHTSD